MDKNDLRNLAAAGWMMLAAATAFAQGDEPITRTEPAETLFFVGGAGPVLPLGGAVDVIGGQGSVIGGVIEGRPYSAESVTESTQMLADGNRIVHTNRSRLYRDSAGRTRREQTLAALGPWSAGPEPAALVVIDDPVERVSYVLDPRAKTARSIRQFQFAPAAAAARAAPPVNVVIAARTDAGVTQQNAGPGVFVQRLEAARLPAAPEGGASVDLPPPPPGAIAVAGSWSAFEAETTTEDLGEQVLEGVVAHGTRQIQTIPAGAIGNERAIERVTEQWYSSELGALLLQRTFDPRFGETVYRLVSVARGEPPPELFQVPSDYQLLESAPAFGEGQDLPGRRTERRMLMIAPEDEETR